MAVKKKVQEPTLRRCCLLYPWCVFLYVLLLGFIAFISVLFWTSWRPMKPSYTIVDLSMPVMNALLKPPPSDTNISLTVKVLNPNRAFSIHFITVNLTISYGDLLLGEARAIKVPQLKPTESRLLVDEVPTKKQIGSSLRSLAASPGKVDLQVHLHSNCSYRFLSWYHPIDARELYGTVPVGIDGKIPEGGKISLSPHSSARITKVSTIMNFSFFLCLLL